MNWGRETRRQGPTLALVLLLVLLAAGVVVAVLGERGARAEMAREASAQGDLLASAVSGALAFDDRAAAQDYVDAVQVNPNVLAAAIYDSQDRMVAAFSREGEPTPPVAQRKTRHATLFENRRLIVVRPVEQGGQYLGTARLRLRETPAAQRFTRYAGLMLVLALAALVVAVLAIAQSALRRANAELASRATELEDKNAELHLQMAERERAEEALRQSQKMEALGRLVGGIAHDFNNLLMVASSAVDLLDRTEDPARRKKLTDGVRQAVDRGSGLTRQLLAFSRRAPLKTAVIDPARQIEGLRILLERSLREDIRVELRFDAPLWPIEIDVGELELALINLAVNARDAMPNGGVLTISGENRPGEDGAADLVCIKVADTGTGMEPEVLARVFEPFFTTKEVGRGTGLGLSQVYGFTRSSGGVAHVNSEVGRGTTFTLCLPAADKPLTEAVAPTELRGAPGSGRVLLVEDDDAVAEGVGQMLNDLGYSFMRAPTAAQGLEMLNGAGGFDLVLSDMVMPGPMDGLALARAIREKRPDQPVMLSTGFSEAAEAARASGFPLLQKPYRLEELSNALREALHRPA